MKKGQVYEGVIEKVEFPNKGIVSVEGEEKKVRFGYNKPKRLIGFNGIITNKVWVLRK